MNRLTKDDVKEMGMVDLAHNQVFIKDGEAWYRDFEREISVRDLAKEMFDFHNVKYSSNLDEFDEDMMYLLEDDYQTIEGVIALFYRSLWAFADIREILKAYEDIGLEPEEVYKTIKAGVPEWIPKYLEYRNLEEQGLLIKLPCKPYTKVYEICNRYDKKEDNYIKTIQELLILRFAKNQYFEYAVVKDDAGEDNITLSQFGKSVFLTREEAEKALNKEVEN